MSRRNAFGAALLGASLLLLAGCVSPGANGPVVAGPLSRPDPYYQGFVDPPRDGASPEETVTGFLRAGSQVKRNYAAARLYLTGSAVRTWQPYDAVTVFSASAALKVKATPASVAPSVSPSTPVAKASPAAAQATTVEVRAPVQARIDARGGYSAASPGDVSTATFSLTKVEGNWRISRAPKGLLISAADFTSTFRPYSIYFADLTRRFLVPDVRWYPVSEGVSTTLTQALLAGPAAWLATATVTGAPAGTALAEPVVTVTDGVARVDLSDGVRTASGAQRRILQRQLEETLTQVLGVQKVAITVRGASLSVVEGPLDKASPGSVRLTRDPGVAGQPMVLDERGRIAQLGYGKTNDERVTDPVAETEQLSRRGVWAGIAQAASGVSFAAVTAARTEVWVQSQGGAPVVRRRGAGLSIPSYDPMGWVWSGDGQGTVQAAAVGSTSALGIKAPWLAGQRVVSLRISRDGARAVVVVAQGLTSTVYVSAVVRRSDGSPTELSPPLVMPSTLTSVDAAAWVDEDHVALLGTDEAGVRRVRIGQVGGSVAGSRDVVPADAITLAAGNGPQDLYVGTLARRVYVRAGASWIPVADASAPTFAG